MLEKTLLVRSDVIANDGCAVTMDTEGTEHVRIAFGEARNPFELLVHHKILGVIVQLGTETLRNIGTAGPDDDERRLTH